MGIALLVIGLIYFLAHALSASFERSRVPDVLGLVLLGIIIGPVTGLVPTESFGGAGPVLTTIALAVILFESGTSLRLQTIWESAGHVLFITLATSITTALVVAFCTATLAGLPWISAAILGAVVSGTSSAVVIPMVRALKAGATATTVLTLESAITDVLSIVATFALVRAATADTVEVGAMVAGVVAAFGAALLLGVFAGLMWLTVWNVFRNLPNTLFTTLAFGFVIFGVAELAGVSGAIAVLAFGVTLANFHWLEKVEIFRARDIREITKEERAFFEEMVFLLKTFFFVFLGISIRFSSFSVTLMAAAVLLVVYALRLVVTRCALAGCTLRDRQIASFMIPKGLAAAVLAGIPMQAGIDGGEAIRDWAYQLVFLSILITALMGALADAPWARRVYAPLLGREVTPVTEPAAGEGTERAG